MELNLLYMSVWNLKSFPVQEKVIWKYALESGVEPSGACTRSDPEILHEQRFIPLQEQYFSGFINFNQIDVNIIQCILL